MNEAELKEIHKRCDNNRSALEKTNLCGCFCCRRTYNPSEIHEWIDGGETALCAKCSIDSVLALDDSVDNTSMLEEMYVYWFSLTYDEDGQLVHDWSE